MCHLPLQWIRVEQAEPAPPFSLRLAYNSAHMPTRHLDLFAHSAAKIAAEKAPLADRIRPRTGRMKRRAEWFVFIQIHLALSVPRPRPGLDDGQASRLSEYPLSRVGFLCRHQSR